MRPPARENEEVVVKEALKNLGIPLLKEFNGGDGFFEGCLLLSKETVFVADTERHTYPFIREFISNILNEFNEVIYARIPKARRYMHPDTVFNRIQYFTNWIRKSSSFIPISKYFSVKCLKS